MSHASNALLIFPYLLAREKIYNCLPTQVCFMLWEQYLFHLSSSESHVTEKKKISALCCRKFKCMLRMIGTFFSVLKSIGVLLLALVCVFVFVWLSWNHVLSRHELKRQSWTWGTLGLEMFSLSLQKDSFEENFSLNFPELLMFYESLPALSHVLSPNSGLGKT